MNGRFRGQIFSWGDHALNPPYVYPEVSFGEWFEGCLWQSDEPLAGHTATVEPVAKYEPGKFYMQELSPLLKVITQIGFDVHTHVIDGYCHLSLFVPAIGIEYDVAA